MSSDTLGHRIEIARTAKGYSRVQLARRLSIKSATLGNWENDLSEPRANKLSMLAGVLGVTIYWLMTGKGDDTPTEEQLLGTATLQQKLDAAKGVSHRLSVILADLEGDIARLQRRLDEENEEAMA
ncbi:helix-turn-helix domain-containing protein [Curvivirga sp.]|uniref:helix-turn-helix domain-containing protein n=1 Tax=Curvivirga sp. TaxID=2856848 RepID=UPI003B5BE400